jgi:hypothetical protein
VNIQPNGYNSILTTFSDNVNDILSSNDLARYKGSELLNPIQFEVNEFNERVEDSRKNPEVTMSMIQQDMGNTLNRIRLISKDTQQKNFSVSGLGNIDARLSMMDVPAWKAALQIVSVKIDSLGTQYSTLMSNSPGGAQIDDNMAQTLNNLEAAFYADQTPAGAKRASAVAIAHLTNIEKMLQGMKQQAMQSELEYIVTKKDAEMLSLISALKMHEEKLTKSEKAVVAKHNSMARQLLNHLKSDSMSYDRAIRQQRLDVIDTHLSVLRKLRDNMSFRENLAGGQFITPRHPSTKTYGFGNLPKRRYHEHQTHRPSNRGLHGPFRKAPAHKVRGFHGLGSIGGNSQLKPTPRDSSGAISVSQGELIDILNENVLTVQAQGYAAPGDEAILRDQLSGITIEAFGGDQQLYDAAKGTYLNTIEHMKKEYVLKAKQGAIADMVPPEDGNPDGDAGIPAGYYQPLGFGARLGITLGGIAAITIPIALYAGWQLAKTDMSNPPTGDRTQGQKATTTSAGLAA